MLEYYLLQLIQCAATQAKPDLMSGDPVKDYQVSVHIWDVIEYIREIEYDAFDGPAPGHYVEFSPVVN